MWSPHSDTAMAGEVHASTGRRTPPIHFETHREHVILPPSAGRADRSLPPGIPILGGCEACRTPSRLAACRCHLEATVERCHREPTRSVCHRRMGNSCRRVQPDSLRQLQPDSLLRRQAIAFWPRQTVGPQCRLRLGINPSVTAQYTRGLQLRVAITMSAFCRVETRAPGLARSRFRSRHWAGIARKQLEKRRLLQVTADGKACNWGRSSVKGLLVR